MAAVLSPLRIPLQAMVVALAGVGMAWLCLNDRWLLGLAATGAIILVGVVCDLVARAAIVKWPLLAAYLFQGWLLIPLAVAVMASAAIIVVAIKTTLPKENQAGEPTSTETEKLVAGIAGGFTTFLTAGFVSWTSDADDSKLADHVRKRFEGRFVKADRAKKGDWVIERGSPAENWVFGRAVRGVDGWSWKARLARARGVKAGLEAQEIARRS